jgi:glc operon protein GlcG
VKCAKPAGLVLNLLILGLVQAVEAQQQTPAPAAVRITLEEAKTALDAAEAEARRNGWNLAFVISDAEGTPIYMRRMDGVPKRNYDVAMNKISTSIAAGMNTAEYAAAVRAGTIQPIDGALTFDGGLLLRRQGQVVGAFSASGASGAQDAQAVRAGLAAIGADTAPPVASPAPAAAAPASAAPASAAPEAMRLPAEVLDRYVGVYEAEQGITFTVRRDGDTLLGQPEGQSERVLEALSETRFMVRGIPADALGIEFVRDEAGVMYKVLRQGGQELRARRR